MKNRYPMGVVVFLLLLSQGLWAQKSSVLLKDDISIRSISIYKGKVFYAGSKSKIGYVSLHRPSDQKQIQVSQPNLEFRSLGRHGKFFYATSIDTPAFFYKINVKTLEATLLGKDESKSAFYDAIHFTNSGEGWTFSDSDTSCPRIAKFNFATETWDMQSCDELPTLAIGEAAFAASNTNIASKKDRLWIATGGIKSRILRRDKGVWKRFETPFVQGISSSGMYSIDFYSETLGIAVGGDYTNQTLNKGVIATTRDGGETWELQAEGKNAGYSTCVKYRPGSKGKQIVALGDQHLSFSEDAGKTWRVLSNEKGLYACEWQNSNTLIAAGRGKIVKFDFKGL
ncbi:WD40/YVTN/BNR-like repeat-containing protein [Chryseobacterium sp. A301]